MNLSDQGTSVKILLLIFLSELTCQWNENITSSRPNMQYDERLYTVALKESCIFLYPPYRRTNNVICKF